MELQKIIIPNNIRSLSVQIMTLLSSNYFFFSPYLTSLNELRLYSNFTIDGSRVIIKICSSKHFNVSLVFNNKILYSKDLSPYNILNDELITITTILRDIIK